MLTEKALSNASVVFLQLEEAKTSSPLTKYELNKEIQESQQKIKELTGRLKYL